MDHAATPCDATTVRGHHQVEHHHAQGGPDRIQRRSLPHQDRPVGSLPTHHIQQRPTTVGPDTTRIAPTITANSSARPGTRTVANAPPMNVIASPMVTSRRPNCGLHPADPPASTASRSGKQEAHQERNHRKQESPNISSGSTSPTRLRPAVLPAATAAATGHPFAVPPTGPPRRTHHRDHAADDLVLVHLQRPPAHGCSPPSLRTVRGGQLSRAPGGPTSRPPVDDSAT